MCSHTPYTADGKNTIVDYHFSPYKQPLKDNRAVKTVANLDKDYAEYGFILINWVGLLNGLSQKEKEKEGVNYFDPAATLFHEILDHFKVYMDTDKQKIAVDNKKDRVKNYNKAARAAKRKERTGETHE